MILKHISALARTLCDTLKMILMRLIWKFDGNLGPVRKVLWFTITVTQANRMLLLESFSHRRRVSKGWR